MWLSLILWFPFNLKYTYNPGAYGRYFNISSLLWSIIYVFQAGIYDNCNGGIIKHSVAVWLKLSHTLQKHPMSTKRLLFQKYYEYYDLIYKRFSDAMNRHFSPGSCTHAKNFNLPKEKTTTQTSQAETQKS